MKPFLNEDFLLKTETSRQLYHNYAKDMPIIDYHCHLSPQLIAEDASFENLTQAWLYGDHYKWRAMRTNGVDERFITGDATDWEKFQKWAETVPYTLRNPLYHWTHLELQRYFGIHDILTASTAKKIYDEASAKLRTPEFSIRNLLRKMNVRIVCTTDDPIDDLRYHRQLQIAGFEIPIRPAFRPDNAMNVADPARFNAYVEAVGKVAQMEIKDFKSYLSALKSRHDFFAFMGCTVSDHGLEQIYAEDYTDAELDALFEKISRGQSLHADEQRRFMSGMLHIFATWDHAKGWVQQYHLGAFRNNNTRMLAKLGPDTGWDSIGDFRQGLGLTKFLNKLDTEDKLTKTILYNLNPADNELFATMIGNFNDGSVVGKVQWGSGWWYNDQKDGMTSQLNVLGNMGLLSRFVGMLTDSRSFLSFPGTSTSGGYSVTCMVRKLRTAKCPTIRHG